MRPDVGWGGRFGAARQYSTAGWLAALGPLLSPHYQVLMSLGHATGWVEIEGQRTAFRDAPFYAEKNWGRGFPRKWWWLQCNAFDAVEPASELTLTATGARPEPAGRRGARAREDVGLVGIHWDGEFWPFPEVEWTVAPWGVARSPRSTGPGTSCTIEAETDDEAARCACRRRAAWSTARSGTYRGVLRVTMFDKGREVVSATTRHAYLETGGEFDAEWVAKSAMTEPLKSVAYNVDLETAISSLLDEARRAGLSTCGL